MATYTPNVPQPSDIPAKSQSQFLGNFQSIDDGTNGFARNHVSLTDATVAQRGKHKYVQMPVQTPNGPVTAVSEGALYTKTGTGSQPQLFWRPQSQIATGNEVQMTGVMPVVSTNGYTFLPGGILFQWGYAIASSTGTTSFTFAGLGLLNFSSVFGMNISQDTSATLNQANAYAFDSLTTTGFKIRTYHVQGSSTFFFTVIGRI